MTDREYALFLFERQKRDRFRRLKAQIRARLILANPAGTQPRLLLRQFQTSATRPSTLLMGFHKHYLNNLLCACSPDNGFAQERCRSEQAGVEPVARLFFEHFLDVGPSPIGAGQASADFHGLEDEDVQGLSLVPRSRVDRPMATEY